MSSEHDAPAAARSGMKLVVIASVVVALFGAAALLGLWLGGRQTAEPAAAVEPAPAQAAAPAPAVETPTTTIEASRDPAPRPKKKVEPAAPPPARAGCADHRRAAPSTATCRAPWSSWTASSSAMRRSR